MGTEEGPHSEQPGSWSAPDDPAQWDPPGQSHPEPPPGPPPPGQSGPPPGPPDPGQPHPEPPPGPGQAGPPPGPPDPAQPHAQPPPGPYGPDASGMPPGGQPGAGWPPPPGPGAPPGWGPPPQPYGFGPQQPRKGKAGLIVGLVGGGLVLIIVVAVALVALSGEDKPDPKKVSTQAAQQIQKARGLTLTGSYGGGSASFFVTKAGTSRATYTSNGSQVTQVTVSGSTYIKSDRSFWAGQSSGGDADELAGKWVRAPASAIDVKPAERFSPTRLAQGLQGFLTPRDLPKERVDGTRALKIATGETTYYVSEKKPYRILRIRGGGAEAWSLKVASLTSSALGPQFATLRGDVKGFEGARDPSVQVISQSKKFSGCSSSGCTVNATVRAMSTQGSTSSVQIRMTAKFLPSRFGSPITTCTDTASATSGSSVKMSCRTSNGKWRSWYRSHVGSFTVYGDTDFETTVNSAGDVNGLISRLTQEEQNG